MKYNMTLQDVMMYSQMMLANIIENDIEALADGVTHKLAKPTLPRKCPKCKMKSFCDCVWINSDGHNFLVRSCPNCCEVHFVAYPDVDKPFIAHQMNLGEMRKS